LTKKKWKLIENWLKEPFWKLGRSYVINFEALIVRIARALEVSEEWGKRGSKGKEGWG